MLELIVSLVLTYSSISTAMLATNNTTLPMYLVFTMLAPYYDDQIALVSVTMLCTVMHHTFYQLLYILLQKY